MHMRSRMRNEMKKKTCDEMRNEIKDEMKNELTNEMKNEMKSEMRNDVLFEDKALSAIVDLTSLFLVRAVSIFLDTKDNQETSSAFIAKR
jgi:hypothetical protein